MSKEYKKNELFANDELTDGDGFSLEKLARSAAQQIIQAALENEVMEFLAGRARYEKTRPGEVPKGYRNGHHRERVVSTAVGGLVVKVPRVSDTDEKYERRSSGVTKGAPKSSTRRVRSCSSKVSRRVISNRRCGVSSAKTRRSVRRRFRG